MSWRVRSISGEATNGVSTRTAGPAIYVTALAAVLLCAVLLFISARQADRISLARQSSLLAAAVQEAARDTAHEQEAVTIWNEAVEKIRKRDLAWVDANLGIWMHHYYGHDEVLITELDGRPVYQMKEGVRVAASSDTPLARAARPLRTELGRKLKHIFLPEDGTGVTVGAINIAFLSSHPAVVSVKPIAWEKASGTRAGRVEYLHVSAKYLDGPLLDRLARQYQLSGLAFVRTAPRDDRAHIPLLSPDRQRLGFLVWHPFRPGTLVAARIAPAMAVAVALIAALVLFLWRRVRTGMLKLQASEAQAQHIAFHDLLTGLANRNLFEEQTARELARVRDQGGAVAYLRFDLHGFKQINDMFGHRAGDELLKTVTDRLLACIGPADLLGRLAGNEFAILQADIADPAAAEVLSAAVMRAVREPFSIAGTRADIGASIGIAIAPPASDAAELARRADIALFEAKRKGRNCWRLFEPEMDANRRGRREIQEALQIALDAGDQLELHYQPIVSARSLAVIGAEALLRWRHPLNGLLSPSLFVPLAEEIGLIERIGEWVLERAISDFTALPGLTLAVNVSPVQLHDPRFADKVLALLNQKGFDPRRLEIEITETSFIENAALCRPNLHKLRAHGVRVALDDFGTGYSSFTHLREFDVDRIKIDRSFVSGIGAGDQGVAIIRSIVSLARACGLSVTAEGVETPAQRGYLARAGCTSLQGYLLGRPMPLAGFLPLAGFVPRREEVGIPAVSGA